MTRYLYTCMATCTPDHRPEASFWSLRKARAWVAKMKLSEAGLIEVKRDGQPLLAWRRNCNLKWYTATPYQY